jgi:membrane protein implicated in regulation of membrane protease activity
MLIGAILTIVAPVLFLVGVMSIGGSTDVQLVAIIALIVGIWLIVLGRRAWRHERPDRSRTRI